MRKPRDYDAELKALNDRAHKLRERRVVQLGELVIACAADALPVEQLAGVLLDAVATTDAAVKEGWRTRGVAFFQRKARTAARAAGRDSDSAEAGNGGAASTAGTTGA